MDAPAPTPDAAAADPRARRLLRLLEAGGVALLLLAALVPRARDLDATFDREYDGFQGAFFALCAINYERLGVLAYGGYPALNVDLPDDPSGLYLYGNHPPAVPLVAWASLKLLGPEGWGEAWREGRPPEGAEAAVRLPFLVLHVAGLVGLWWAVREGVGARRAMLALAVVAAVPVSALYGGLVNYENPSLGFTLLAYGAHARWLRRGARGFPVAAGVLFGCGAAFTFTPLFFLPPLVLQHLLARRRREARVVASFVGACALLPIVAHGFLVLAALPEQESAGVLTRGRHLLGPLLAGEAPPHLWLAKQVRRLAFFASTPVVLAAGLGLALHAARALRARRRTAPAAAHAPGPAPADPGPPLLLGGLLVMLAFYRHTWDGAGVRDGQTVFLLNVVPGLAALAAVPLDAVGARLARGRAGLAPLVVLVGAVLLPALLRTAELRRDWRAPGPADAPPGPGPDAPLPATVGRELRALVPPGAVCLVPSALGLNVAPAYYAWRTMQAVDHATWGAAMVRIEEAGLGDRPLVLVLPRDPSPAVRAQTADLRADLAARTQPLAEDARWEVWPLEEAGG